MGTRKFTLRARADRIEHRRRQLRHPRLQDRRGRSEKQVRTGLAPQLTLEAAILRAGGFKSIAGGSVSKSPM